MTRFDLEVKGCFFFVRATSTSVCKVNIFFSFFKSSITWHTTWDVSKIDIYLTCHLLKEHPESVGEKIMIDLMVLIIKASLPDFMSTKRKLIGHTV